MRNELTTAGAGTANVAWQTGLDEFWNITARERLKAQFALSKEMELVARISSEALREILLQYRFFTLAFTTDIAILVGRCPPSKLRSLLGGLLNDELGQGDPTQAHPALYDRFLVSIGAIAPGDNEATLECRMPDEVRSILADLHRETCDGSLSYTIGLRGMGGECVCGVYFAELHKRIVEHPLIASRFAEIDWTFWDIHAGHADEEHDVGTRAAISAFAALGELDVQELMAGYEQGVRSWSRFWQVLYQTHVAAHARC